jgi:hypothetical protein
MSLEEPIKTIKESDEENGINSNLNENELNLESTENKRSERL